LLPLHIVAVQHVPLEQAPSPEHSISQLSPAQPTLLSQASMPEQRKVVLTAALSRAPPQDAWPAQSTWHSLPAQLTTPLQPSAPQPMTHESETHVTSAHAPSPQATTQSGPSQLISPEQLAFALQKTSQSALVHSTAAAQDSSPSQVTEQLEPAQVMSP